MSVVVGRRGGLRGEVVGRLAQLGGLHAEAELTGPRDAAHVVGIARWRGGSKPLGRLVSDEVEVGTVLPRHLLRLAVVADDQLALGVDCVARSEEHTSELQSLMRISYAVFCLKNNM